jgi:D-sedoheptulose 7-phosphate isomerase
MNYENEFAKYLFDSSHAIGSLASQQSVILELVASINRVISNKGCIFWAGNGGSAADAQHLAAELVGRFEVEREPIKSIALTTDSSVITAVGNDFGFDKIFSRQISGLVSENDLIIFITTSGKSKNILNGLKIAQEIGCKTAVLTGKAKLDCDYLINVNSSQTCHIQEAHITAGQLICKFVEDFWVHHYKS